MSVHPEVSLTCKLQAAQAPEGVSFSVLEPFFSGGGGDSGHACTGNSATLIEKGAHSSQS